MCAWDEDDDDIDDVDSGEDGEDCGDDADDEDTCVDKMCTVDGVDDGPLSECVRTCCA